MDIIEIRGRKISFENPNQVINMGGPWVGSLFLDDRKILENVVLDNFFYNETSCRLYFVLYHEISNWQIDNYFSIIFLDLNSNDLFEYELKFSQVYIKNIENHELIYFDAFHDKNDSKKNILNLNGLEFRKVSIS